MEVQIASKELDVDRYGWQSSGQSIRHVCCIDSSGADEESQLHEDRQLRGSSRVRAAAVRARSSATGNDVAGL